MQTKIEEKTNSTIWYNADSCAIQITIRPLAHNETRALTLMVWGIWKTEAPFTRGFHLLTDQGVRKSRDCEFSTLKKRDFSTWILLKTLKLPVRLLFFPELACTPLVTTLLLYWYPINSHFSTMTTFPYAKVNCTCNLGASHLNPSLSSTFSFHWRHASLHQVSLA